MDTQYDFYEIFNSDDITICCKNLGDFIESLSSIRNRKRILRGFKEQAGQHILNETLFLQMFKKSFYYKLIDGIEAVRNYCATIIEYTSQLHPSDNNIQFLKEALDIMLSFTHGMFPVISKSFINEFMGYIDDKYEMSKKINNIYINIINYQNLNVDGHTVNTNPELTSSQYIFLYKIRNPDITPQHVFFHELGHVLQNTYNYKTKTQELPQCFVDYINKSPYCASIDRVQPSHIPELFADLISLGMVYDTPYIKLHYFYNHTSDIFQKELHDVYCALLYTIK